MEYTSPVDPSTNVVLSNNWIDATGYDGENQFGPHSGNDLNKNQPHWNADAGAPVYAIGDGIVTCSQSFPTWHWLIVIDHSTPTNTLMSRYAHVLSAPDKVLVKVGQRVTRGQPIAFVGNADGTQADHLHVDLSPTDLLRISPSYYPKTHAQVRMYFIDMIKFLLDQGEPPTMAITFSQYKNVHGVVNVRRLPTTDNAKGTVIGSTALNTVVNVVNEVSPITMDGYEWRELSTGGWTAVKPVDGAAWFVPFP